jgi:transposase
MLGLGGARIEDVGWEDDSVIVHAVPSRRGGHRCGICGRVGSRYGGSHRRRWRALDLGTSKAYVEAEIVRVRCLTHGVVTERVPWASHWSRFTRSFEDQVAWLTIEASKLKVAELMRISWRSVDHILERLYQRSRERTPGLGCRRPRRKDAQPLLS